jgi:Uma2 family endonuclease
MLELAHEGRAVSVQIKRWTREEFERLVRLGVLGEDDHVQLIEGEIVEMPRQRAPHAAAVTLAMAALQEGLPQGYHVRVQLPLALDPHSEPQPDVAIVRGGPRDYVDQHPAGAELVVEVSETTVDFDRNRKGPLYARASIPEYWIVDINARVVEVWRDPGPDPEGQVSYRTVSRHGPDASIAPVALPDRQVAVRNLLP